MDLESLKLILNKVNVNNLKKSNIKNILITGCSGFIGNYLLNTLLSEKIKNKFKIYGLDILMPKISFNKKKVIFIFIKKIYLKLKVLN